jgi:hypothetical protein
LAETVKLTLSVRVEISIFIKEKTKMILRNCELWFARLDPKRPNNKFNKENPTWEVQLRTTDPAQKNEWKEAGLRVDAVIPDQGESFFRVNLRKKSIRADGNPSQPVKVVNASLEEIDGSTIGNGSIGHVRLYQYDKKTGPGVVSMLMEVQVIKHIVYKPKPRTGESFSVEGDTEVIDPSQMEDEAEEEAAF